MFPGVGPFTSLLDMSDPSWQRVYVLKTAAGNLCYAAGTPADYEKISVFCGPVLLALGSTSYEPGPGEQGLDPDETAFIEAIYKRTVDLDSLILAQRQGYLPLAAPVNLDVNLQDNFLVAGNEFLILSSAHNSSPNPTYRAGVDSVADAVQIVPSAEVFYDNCFGDLDQGYVRSEPAASLSVESLEAAGLEAAVAAKVLPLLQSANPKLLDEESFVRRPFDSSTNIATALSSLPLTSVQLEQVRSAMFASLGTFVPFQGISPVNGHVITVKNQPGWFQFDNGDESFLLTLSPTPQPGPGNVALPPFQTLESAASLHRPTLSPASFAIAEVGAKRGEAVYTYLCQYSLIDKNGNAVYDRAFEVFALDSLAEVLANVAPKLSGAQVKAIGNVLLNSPFAVADSFICSGINKATAEKIAAQLEGNGVIDVTGRVTMTLLTGEFIAKALTNMVLNKEITEAQVPLIYQMLVALTAPVELAYRNEGVPQPHSIWDYTFDVTRTSTGAVDQLSRRLFARGVPGLLELEAQQIPVVPVLPFERFSPDEYNLNWPAAIDGAQVDFQGVYGTYFWEVFFHVPILVATSLSSNQQFAAAERWFRYVLDPTVPEQFVLAPMFTQPSPETISPAQAQTIYGELQHTKVGEPPGFAILDEQGRVNKQFGATTDLSFLLGSATSAAAQSIVRNVLLNHQVASDADHYWQFQPFRNAKPESLHEMLSDEAAIEAYEDHPFDPHAIAALRIGAYEKSVLMQYVQNLTAWADAQFSRESFESITQATMLYVYAYDLLGERPVDLGPPPAREAKTFAQIKAEYPKEIPPFLIELEHTLAPLRSTVPAVDEGGTPFNALNTYFCMPENEQLLRMWDTLEDRLYKIRNSMNIEGEVRQLPLFAPPLNPLELVKAAGSEGGFLPAAEDSATLPAYRFTVMLERARAVTAQVSDFGAKLLAAMEKQDAETLELLRSTQESQILAMMTAIKQDGIADLTETIAGLRANLQSAKSRVSHYQGLISTGLSDSENTNLEAMAASLAFNLLATGLRAAATIAYTVPQVGSPFAMTYGGVQIGSALTAASTVAEIGGDISNFIASRSLTMAGYERREQDWTLALAEAQYDVTSLEKQIAAAQARLEGAGRELAVNAAEISQNAQVYEYLKDKFTSKSLYQWMVSRIAAVYFQAYRLALELSQAAQGSYQFELGVQENFLAFNYWDSLRKGLMAGENLSFSLSQMEASYLSKNTRRLEIERTVSLAMWNPKALWELKRAGACAFKLTEELYDYDYPGHYNRQIKSVSLSIPAVIGPYENFKATLKQTCSVVATSAEEDVAGYLLGSVKTKPTSGLREDREPRQQVAISRGVDDSGVFELDFHDERYLPFEGTGAVSSWELQLPQSTNRFDLNAIGDVIVTVRYTAIDGGEPYAKEVKALLGSNPLPGACYLSLAQAYQSQWAAFMANHSEPEKQVLSFEVAPGALAYMKQATLATVYVKLQTAAVAIADGSKFLSASSKGFAEEFSFSGEVGQILKLAVPEDEFVGAWELTFDLKQMRENAGLAALLDAEKQYLDPAKLLNAELILSYEGSVF
jgi:hypothetical protein